MIRTQRLALDAKIRSICRAHVVRKGLPFFKLEGGKASAPGGEVPPSAQERKVGDEPPVPAAGGVGGPPSLPLDIVSIPGVLEACWTPDQAAFGSR